MVVGWAPPEGVIRCLQAVEGDRGVSGRFGRLASWCGRMTRPLAVGRGAAPLPRSRIVWRLRLVLRVSSVRSPSATAPVKRQRSSRGRRGGATVRPPGTSGRIVGRAGVCRRILAVELYQLPSVCPNCLCTGVKRLLVVLPLFQGAA